MRKLPESPPNTLIDPGFGREPRPLLPDNPANEFRHYNDNSFPFTPLLPDAIVPPPEVMFATDRDYAEALLSLLPPPKKGAKK